MKKSAILFTAFICAVLLTVTVSAKYLDDSPLLANWSLTISAQGQEMPGTLKLEKDGDNFKGAVTTDLGEAPLKNVKVEAESFNAEITANIQGQTFEGTMNGKIEEGKIKGEINLTGIGAIPYSGTKAEKK